MDENTTPLFIEIMGALFDPATGNTYESERESEKREQD